jgi:ElaB/YqjD/DUF883 family membrane-anchored ribosome-binding protein
MESTQHSVEESLGDPGYAPTQRNVNPMYIDEDSTLRKIVTEGEELLRKTANFSAEGFAATRDKFQSGLEEIKTRLGEARSVLKDKATFVTEATEDYVDANPWKSLAAAVSVGALIGYMIGRRR